MNPIYNLHIYPTPFRFETRILKETKSLLCRNLVNEVFIASTSELGLSRNEQIDDKRSVKRFELFFGRFKRNFIFDAFKYFEFMLRVFLFYRRLNLKYVNCHSLFVLPIGVMLKMLGSAQYLIYDTHELETERVGLTGIRQRIAKLMERMLIRYVDKVIVVCEPIAQWYKNEYKFSDVYVLRNLPYHVDTPDSKPIFFREKFCIPANAIIFIYQGILAPERGIDCLIDVFSGAGDDKHIVFMGYGKSESRIHDAAKNFKNIHFQPAVSHNQIIECTASADIGVHFIDRYQGLSYRHSLPNKYCEYMMAGIPILVSNYYEYMESLLVEHGTGWSVAGDKQSLLNFVNDLTFSEVKAKAPYVRSYSNSLGWEYEEHMLDKVYS